MPIQFTDSMPPITEEELRAFESKYQLHLPDDYRAFLLKYNGGRPQNIVFHFIREDEAGFVDGSWIAYFYGLGNSKAKSHLEAVYKNGLQLGWPIHKLPIAQTAGKESVVISVHVDDFGTVYFEDSDYTGADEQPNYYKIADSFTSFLEGLAPKN